MIEKTILLRAVEPKDAQILYDWENNLEDWEVSGTTLPFSLESILLFIENQQSDIHISKQVRLMMEYENNVVGCVDLFDFDTKNKRAGVGILVDKNQRGKGLATIALLELEKYAYRLDLHQLYAHIGINNQASIKAFSKAGYRQQGELIDWIKTQKSWEKALIMQKILV